MVSILLSTLDCVVLMVFSGCLRLSSVGGSRRSICRLLSDRGSGGKWTGVDEAGEARTPPAQAALSLQKSRCFNPYELPYELCCDHTRLRIDMDPLSISASIIALLQLSSTIIGYLSDVKGGPKELQKIRLEIMQCPPHVKHSSRPGGASKSRWSLVFYFVSTGRMGRFSNSEKR